MQITKLDDNSGQYRTGQLPQTITAEQITATLGFGPNIDDDPDKVTQSWAFLADGKPCGVWDYKGVRWSTHGPAEVFAALFAPKVAARVQIVTNKAQASDSFDTSDLVAAMKARGYDYERNTRADGPLRIELSDKPQFKGLYGPMWGGAPDGVPILRYEDEESYDILSR